MLRTAYAYQKLLRQAYDALWLAQYRYLKEGGCSCRGDYICLAHQNDALLWEIYEALTGERREDS